MLCDDRQQITRPDHSPCRHLFATTHFFTWSIIRGSVRGNVNSEHKDFGDASLSHTDMCYLYQKYCLQRSTPISQVKWIYYYLGLSYPLLHIFLTYSINYEFYANLWFVLQTHTNVGENRYAEQEYNSMLKYTW